ncbi:MAG: LysR family transcriptional regulator [Rhodobacteraceae bacterium]|nr:LysR family transcriptional regulator [Paracoccaceae bacterium]
MKQLSWDDWQVFLHVAETGGLSGAARRTGLSPPTIGRRMLALEQRIGQTLFVRAQTGYRLTPAGAALRDRLRPMSAAASAVATFLSDTGEAPLIRLSAGTGTTAFLADRFAQLCRPGDAFRLHFVTTEATLDLAHRAARSGDSQPPARGRQPGRAPSGHAVLCPLPKLGRGAPRTARLGRAGSLGCPPSRGPLGASAGPSDPRPGGVCRHPAQSDPGGRGHRRDALHDRRQRPGIDPGRPGDRRTDRSPVSGGPQRRPPPPAAAPGDRASGRDLSHQRRSAGGRAALRG